MATVKNAIVTKIDAGTAIRQNEYLGSVRHIPINVNVSALETGDIVELSKPLPQNTQVVGLVLGHSAMGNAADKLSVGVTGALTALADEAAVENAGTINYSGLSVEASGKVILGTVVANTNWGATKALTGYLLIVTDQ